jgi:hypothetical protein
MATHNPEDSAGSQLAMIVALKLLLSQYRGNPEAIAALESELERMRALLLVTFPRFFVFQQSGFMLPVFPLVEPSASHA